MYNNYEEEEDDWDLPEDKDPFQEDVNTEVNIGTVQVSSVIIIIVIIIIVIIYIVRYLIFFSLQVFLQPIAYMVEMKEQLEVTDLKGNKIGIMNVRNFLTTGCFKKEFWMLITHPRKHPQIKFWYFPTASSMGY